MPAIRATALAAATLLPLAAPAQQASWWDVLGPDRIAEGLVISLLGGARTQLDLTYGDLSVDLLAARLVLTDLSAWPFLDWDMMGDCNITADRIVMAGAPLGNFREVRAYTQVYGLVVPEACFPEEARAALGMAGLSGLDLSYFGSHLDYDLPSAGLNVTMEATLPGFAAATIEARFDYAWFEAPVDSDEEPLPVAFLEHALVSLENLGGWDAVQARLPPQIVNPGSAQLLIEGGLGTMLAEMNRSAAGPDATPEAGTLSPAQEALVRSAIDAWGAFLAEPERLVLETGHDIVFVDTLAWAEDPRLGFEALKPTLSTQPSAALAAIPRETLQAWVGGTAGSLPAPARRTLAEALIEGVGAPRDVAGGVGLLVDLADAGDGEAAILIARAIETREPGTAYAWALRAGAEQAPGAATVLDRLERGLPLDEVLTLQAQSSPPLIPPLPTGAALGVEARAAMTGNGTPRSYARAAVLARLSAAAGAPEGLALLEEIDRLVAAHGEDGRAAWAGYDAQAAQQAMSLWLEGAAD